MPNKIFTCAAVGAALAGVIIYANLPIRYTLRSRKAEYDFLANAPLWEIDEMGEKSAEVENFPAENLWANKGAVIMAVRRPGCLLCRKEGAQLSALAEELRRLNFELFAVGHELLGLADFRRHFAGKDVYLDPERRFFGGTKNLRFLSFWHGALRYNTWANIFRAKQDGFHGNFQGEGRILGGVFVMGPGQPGILLEHQESEWGDSANTTEILETVKKFAYTA